MVGHCINAYTASCLVSLFPFFLSCVSVSISKSPSLPEEVELFPRGYTGHVSLSLWSALLSPSCSSDANAGTFAHRVICTRAHARTETHRRAQLHTIDSLPVLPCESRCHPPLLPSLSLSHFRLLPSPCHTSVSFPLLVTLPSPSPPLPIHRAH